MRLGASAAVSQAWVLLSWSIKVTASWGKGGGEMGKDSLLYLRHLILCS